MRKWYIVAGICLYCNSVGWAYNEYAPNSFAEVERNRPAYRVVAPLIEAGYAPGYGKALLQRSQLSRYEFAKALKSLLENKSHLTSAQWESLDVAKSDYERELAALGYREEEMPVQPEIQWGGEIRLRHSHEDGENRTDGRVRVGMEIPVK